MGMKVAKLIHILEQYNKHGDKNAEVFVHTELGTRARFGVSRPVTEVRGVVDMDTNIMHPTLEIEELTDEELSKEFMDEILKLKNNYTFPAIFHVAEDGVSIEFPDLPGCLPCASDLKEGLENAHKALHLHLYGMEQDGDKIPNPTPRNQIKVEPNEVVVLINSY